MSNVSGFQNFQSTIPFIIFPALVLPLATAIVKEFLVKEYACRLKKYLLIYGKPVTAKIVDLQTDLHADEMLRMGQFPDAKFRIKYSFSLMKFETIGHALNGRSYSIREYTQVIFMKNSSLLYNIAREKGFIEVMYLPFKHDWFLKFNTMPTIFLNPGNCTNFWISNAFYINSLPYSCRGMTIRWMFLVITFVIAIFSPLLYIIQGCDSSENPEIKNFCEVREDNLFQAFIICLSLYFLFIVPAIMMFCLFTFLLELRLKDLQVNGTSVTNADTIGRPVISFGRNFENPGNNTTSPVTNNANFRVTAPEADKSGTDTENSAGEVGIGMDVGNRMSGVLPLGNNTSSSSSAPVLDSRTLEAIQNDNSIVSPGRVDMGRKTSKDKSSPAGRPGSGYIAGGG